MAGVAVELGRWVRFQVWMRLFLLQGSWNFKQMQGGGWLYAMMPVLRHLYQGEDLLAAVARHRGYFNTHPYFAPAVVGAAIRMELQRVAGESPGSSMAEFKEMVAAPYAAIGDALFWGGLRPLAAAVALLLAVRGLLIAPVVFLLLYNLLPLWFRVYGYRYGYDLGLQSVVFIQRHRLPDLAVHVKETAVMLLGGLSAFLVFTEMGNQTLPLWIGFFVVPMVLAGATLARRGISTLFLLLAVSALVMVGVLFSAELHNWIGSPPLP